MVVGVSMPCIPCSGAWGTGGNAGLVLVNFWLLWRISVHNIVYPLRYLLVYLIFGPHELYAPRAFDWLPHALAH